MAIVDAEKQSVGVILHTRHPFMLPAHQRAYSWTEDEVNMYCDDLKSISTEYFFGGIVCVQNIAQNGPGRTHRVVDGQQRLATFTLTLVRLKNAFDELSTLAIHPADNVVKLSAQAIRDELVDDYIKYRDTKQQPPGTYYRLTLSNTDSQYFIDLIEGRTPRVTSVSHENILYAWNRIQISLIDPIMGASNLSLLDKLNLLGDLKDKLIDKSVIIQIITDHLSDAYQLYEVLNDRGRELEIGDFLRSSTLELLASNPTLQSSTASHWDVILGKAGAEKYLKDYFSSIFGSVKSTHIHKQYEDKFFNYTPQTISSTEQQNVHDRIKEVYDLLDVYNNIIDGVWPYNTRTVNAWEQNRLSLLVNQLKHTSCIPLLLAVYKKLGEQDFRDVVLILEKVVFRYISISGLRANRLIEIYRNQILNIENNNFSLAQLKTELTNLISNYCNDSTFKEALKKLSYSNNNIKKIRYFLSTLEDHYNWYITTPRATPPRPNYSVVHSMDSIDIEHIYPQNPQTIVPQLQSKKNTLGNLTYWAPHDNRAVQNADFLAKKPVYGRSHVALTRGLDQLPTWNTAEVNNRLRLYQDMAVEIFKI